MIWYKIEVPWFNNAVFSKLNQVQKTRTSVG